MERETMADVIRVRTTPTEAAALRRLASERQANVSALIRSLIRYELQARGYLPRCEGVQNVKAA